MSNPITAALADLLTTGQILAPAELPTLLADLFTSPANIDREALQQLQTRIQRVCGEAAKIDLVYGGATRIKGYVFEAPKLPEIRGASALLDWVNEVDLPQLWDEQVPAVGRLAIVYASGGHVLGFAPAGTGERIATLIEQRYLETTLSAESVAVSLSVPLLSLRYGREPLAYWVEEFERDWRNPQLYHALHRAYSAGQQSPIDTPATEVHALFFQRKTFGELVALLRGMANRRRAERGTPDGIRGISPLPLQPWNARCDSSDVRPAVHSGMIADEMTPREISEPSARKRLAGQIAKGNPKTGWFSQAFDWQVPLDLETESWEARWEQYLVEHPGTRYALARAATRGSVDPAPDIEAIAAASSRYIGMIYADGNRVGQFMDASATPDAFRARSERLRSAARSAVFAALSQHLVPHAKHHPFEIIAIGGDDLLIIVPGNRAFDIALSIADHFEHALGTAQTISHTDRFVPAMLQGVPNLGTYQPEVGLSAGVVIAQESAPIFFLRDLVEELLKSAKQGDPKATTGGSIDFMVLKSITMVTNQVAGFRSSALRREDRHLTARPYTWHEFGGLIETIRNLKQARVPKSQLYRIAAVLRDQPSIAATTLEYLYTRERMNATQASALATFVERNWSSMLSA